jgi:phosphoribosyl 1,2-cyclic phosphodiesterase
MTDPLDEPSLTIAGCRGSMCVSGRQYRRFGGNTTCMYARVEPDHHLIIDAGTGLRSLEAEDLTPPHRFTILLTHYHWDHIQGLPLFAPLQEADNHFIVYGAEVDGLAPDEVLAAAVQAPWWPVTVADATARVEFRTLDGPFDVGPVRVTHAPLNHPQGVVGYRLDWHRSIVVATDHETGDPDADRRLTELAAGADVLIHDAQYTPEEHNGAKLGWGHSTWDAAATAAVDAGVGRLVLTSHDPDRGDDDIDGIRLAARSRFSRTDAAYEGMTIPF